MRRAELDSLLSAMLETHDGISDLLFTAGRPYQVETYGELKTVEVAPRINSLTRFQTERIALNIIGHDRRLLRDLVVRGACDCSYAIGDATRFRVNIFRQRGNLSVVMRKMQSVMPTISHARIATALPRDVPGEKRPDPGDRGHWQWQDDHAFRDAR
jgi:twitching motility protein PilT